MAALGQGEAPLLGAPSNDWPSPHRPHPLTTTHPHHTTPTPLVCAGLVNRVTEHRCFIVATCDRDLKRRIRKIPGVPIMFITQRKYSIERMPDAFGAPR